MKLKALLAMVAMAILSGCATIPLPFTSQERMENRLSWEKHSQAMEFFEKFLEPVDRTPISVKLIDRQDSDLGGYLVKSRKKTDNWEMTWRTITGKPITREELRIILQLY